MKRKGNGSPQQCIQNLLKIARGEVPFDRLKGVDPRLIGQPCKTASPQLVSDVRWLLKTYEPRANTSKIDIIGLAAQVGDFELHVDTHIKQQGGG